MVYCSLLTGTVYSVRRGGFTEGAATTCMVIGEKTAIIWNPYLIKPKPSPSTTVLRVQHTRLQNSRVTIFNTKSQQECYEIAPRPEVELWFNSITNDISGEYNELILWAQLLSGKIHILLCAQYLLRNFQNRT
jgi:hypothetical protein